MDSLHLLSLADCFLAFVAAIYFWQYMFEDRPRLKTIFAGGFFLGSVGVVLFAEYETALRVLSEVSIGAVILRHLVVTYWLRPRC